MSIESLLVSCLFYFSFSKQIMTKRLGVILPHFKQSFECGKQLLTLPTQWDIPSVLTLLLLALGTDSAQLVSFQYIFIDLLLRNILLLKRPSLFLTEAIGQLSPPRLILRHQFLKYLFAIDEIWRLLEAASFTRKQFSRLANFPDLSIFFTAIAMLRLTIL